LYKTLLIISAFLLAGCQDKAMTHFYDKSIASKPIGCLRLQVVPDNAEYKKVLESLYRFSDNCNMTLSVSYKSGIVCNSSYNAARKTLSNFPSSYLNMELRQGMSLLYSYYIDLEGKPDSADIKGAWKRIKSDLKITPQN